MNSRFDMLFSVLFQHNFFSDARLHFLHATPSAETHVKFLKNGLIYRRVPQGFHVLYDACHAGKERSRDEVLSPEITLHFILANEDPYFLNYTSGFASGFHDRFFFFSNRRTPSRQRKGLLHNKEFVSADDLMEVKEWEEPFFKKPFGIIQITLDNRLDAVNTIRFDTCATYWRYIIVSDYLKELESLAVIHKETKEAFKGPTAITLPDSKTALMFVSTQAIPLREKPDKSYQLIQYNDASKQKYKIIKTMLPSPQHTSISRGYNSAARGKNNFSEIFI